MTDPQSYYYDSEAKIRERFDLYKSVGVDMLRVEFDWRSQEQTEGKWDSTRIARYLKLAKEYGFRIKLIVGVIMAPPRWYLDKHTDSRIIDQNGGHSTNTMSYWYPGLHKLIDEKTKHMLGILDGIGIWDSVDYLIPSFGPAGEPVYPHPWTLGPDFPVVTYWGYDPNGQISFRAEMRAKYRSVTKANAVWGTDFKSWDEVKVLQPKTKPGPYWNDMLTWYRDSKRRFVEWQIDSMLKYAHGGKKVLVYVPGTGYTEQDWQEAVRTADGNDWIKLMADSKFLVDTAARKGCWLQYTGVDNAQEAANLRRYIDERKYPNVEIWGENAGYFVCAKDPIGLARTITRNDYYGLDLTHAHFVFQQDGVTPNEVFPDLKTAYALIKRYWAAKETVAR